MYRESMVLLENSNNLLPLDIKKTPRILVTGLLAENIEYTTSYYGPSHQPVTSILKGIQDYVGNKGTVVSANLSPLTSVAGTKPNTAEYSNLCISK